QLDWLISTTAMIVLSWSRATRDLLKSFGWGIGALHRLATATMVPSPRRLPHSISRSHPLTRRQTHGSDRMNGAERDTVVGSGSLGPLDPRATKREIAKTHRITEERATCCSVGLPKVTFRLVT